MSYRNHNQINHIVIQGYLTSTPEIKIGKNSTNYTVFHIGVQRYNKRTNETYPNFFQVRAFGSSALRMNVFQKGDLISVDGFLDVSTYKNDENKEVTDVFVTAERVYLSHKKTAEVKQVSNEFSDFNWGYPSESNILPPYEY